MLELSPLIITSPMVTDEACFSVPAVRAIHFENPSRAITILCPEDLVPVWQSVTEVTEVVSYPISASHRKIAKLFGGFSQALVWEGGPVANALSKKKIPKRFGPAGEKFSKWLTNPLEVSQSIGPIEHRVNHYLRIAEKLGGQPFEAGNFQTPPRPPLPRQLRIGIVPGSDFGASAEWELENFRALVSELQAEWIIFESGGRPAAKKLSDLGRVVPEKNVFCELANCHLLIGNDSSVPHLAAHQGIPCVVIFGPNEPSWKRPLGKMHRIVRHHVACSPCFLDKCPLDHRCLSGVSKAEVLQEVRNILEVSGIGHTQG